MRHFAPCPWHARSCQQMSALRAVPSQPAPVPQQPQEESCLCPAGGSVWGLFLTEGSRARVLQNTVLILWSQSPVFYPNTTAHVLVNCLSRQLFIRRGKEVEICVSLPRSASSGGRSMRRCKDRGGDSPTKQGLGPTGLHKLSLSQRGDLTATL